MCDMTVDLDAVLRGHGMPLDTLDADMDGLEPLVSDGILQIAGRRIDITPTGRPFARIAAATFDAYLASSRGRHAIAV